MIDYSFTFGLSAILSIRSEQIAGGRWQPPSINLQYAVSETGWGWIAQKIEEYEKRADFRNVHAVLVPFTNAQPIDVDSLHEAQQIAAIVWVPKVMPTPPTYVDVVFDEVGRFEVYALSNLDEAHGASRQVWGR